MSGFSGLGHVDGFGSAWRAKGSIGLGAASVPFGERQKLSSLPGNAHGNVMANCLRVSETGSLSIALRCLALTV